MPKQLNIFLENKPGRLESITEMLYKSNINIISFTIQDRGDFGVVKVLANKPDQAYLVLADKGFACALKEVLVIAIKDRPGNLHKLTSLCVRERVNILDAHGFVSEPGGQGVCCLELHDAQRMKKLLEDEGFKLLDDKALAGF